MAVVLFVGAEGDLVQLLAQVSLGPIVAGTVARRPRDQSAAVAQFQVGGALLPVEPGPDDPADRERPLIDGGRAGPFEIFGTIANSFRGVCEVCESEKNSCARSCSPCTPLK